jgi:hypothetical protein
VRDATTGFHIVKAGGPLDPSMIEIIELCVWVFQRADASVDDAIAQGMGEEGTAPMPGMDMVIVDRSKTPLRWDMDLVDREGTGAVDYSAGSATAIAIGAFLVEPAPGKRRAFVWSEPVELNVQ